MVKLIEKLREQRFIQIFTIYLRYLLGGTFVFAFLWKIDLLVYDPEKIIPDINNGPAYVFQLVMRLQLLWWAAAGLQLISGILLLTQRYATIGSILFMPVIVCINLMIISVGFQGTWVVTGLLFMANLYLLIWDYKKFLPLFIPSKNYHFKESETVSDYMFDRYWITLGLMILVVTVGDLYYQSIFIWLIGCFFIGFGGWVYAIFIRKNPSPVNLSV